MEVISAVSDKTNKRGPVFITIMYNTPDLLIIIFFYSVKSNLIKHRKLNHSLKCFTLTGGALASTIWVVWWWWRQRSGQGWEENHHCACSTPAFVSCSHAPSDLQNCWWQHPEETLCSAWSRLMPDRTGP